AMGAELGADVARPVAAAGAAAHQRFAEAAIVLPAGLGQPVDRHLRLCRIHAAGGALALEFPARVLAPGQQPQRPLHRRGRLARTPAPWGVIAHVAGARPWPPSGLVSVRWPKPASRGLARSIASCTTGRPSDARWLSTLSQT